MNDAISLLQAFQALSQKYNPGNLNSTFATSRPGMLDYQAAPYFRELDVKDESPHAEQVTDSSSDIAYQPSSFRNRRLSLNPPSIPRSRQDLEIPDIDIPLLENFGNSNSVSWTQPRTAKQKFATILPKTITNPLVSDSLEWAGEKLPLYSRERHKATQGMNLVNRTFNNRLDDHIAVLKHLNFDKAGKVHFIDIGPGVGETSHPDNPAITSREMAQAFPNMNVVALDLPDSVSTYEEAARKNPEIGKRLRNTRNLKVLAGDGMRSLAAQLRNAGEDVKPNEPIVVRATNSIDIYYPWKQVKPVLQQMATDFRTNPVTLFFADKILTKKPGSVVWEKAGVVSRRGFNHNQRTTSHVPSKTPRFTLFSRK